MPITYTETWASDLGIKKGSDGKNTGTAGRTLDCVADSITEANNEFQVNAGLPAINAIHPRLGIGYTLKNKKLARKSPLMWQATLSYETTPFNDEDWELYPWNQPTLVTFGTSNETGPTEQDYNGTEIATVNGEVYNVQKDFADQQITLKRAFLSYSPVTFYEYINTVNTDAFLGFPAGTLRITGIQAAPAYHQNILYYDVTTTILGRRPVATTNDKAWYWRGPMKGTKVKRGGTIGLGMLQGKVTTSPVLIKADGTQWDVGDTVHFQEWQLYDEKAFSGLGYF